MEGLLSQQKLYCHRRLLSRSYRFKAQVCSSAVERTHHSLSAAIDHVSVNHRRGDILVTEKFLNRPYIVARFEQMSGEAVAERVTGCGLCDGGAMEGFSDGFLHNALIRVMAALCA
jgi:hypothetical protein